MSYDVIYVWYVYIRIEVPGDLPNGQGADSASGRTFYEWVPWSGWDGRWDGDISRLIVKLREMLGKNKLISLGLTSWWLRFIKMVDVHGKSQRNGDGVFMFLCF
jgi:hypothetical protein